MCYRAIQVQIHTKCSENNQRKNADLIKAKQALSNIINKDYVKNAPFVLIWRPPPPLHEGQNL